MLFGQRKVTPVGPEDALPGRERELRGADKHVVLGTPMKSNFVGMQLALFGMGCFWGAERKFWEAQPGVHSTAVGYAAGSTPNPTYEEVCSGLTGHTEVVRVVFDPRLTSYENMLGIFWENHDPTQGMRQGGDSGTQYRSGIYWSYLQVVARKRFGDFSDNGGERQENYP